MKLYVAALAGLLAIAGAGSAAQAAPALSGVKGQIAAETLVQKTHGVHRACVRDWRGYHRSPNRWSRNSCQQFKPWKHRSWKHRHHHQKRRWH